MDKPKDFKIYEAHKCCSKNEDAIGDSTLVGCFWCCDSFPSSQVVEFTGDGSGLCPNCGIDSLIPDSSGFKLTRGFLRKMHKFWFSSTHKTLAEYKKFKNEMEGK